MIKKLAIAVVVIAIASLSVSGCTSSTTESTTGSASPAGQVSVTQTQPEVSDHSSYFNDAYAGGSAIIERPFTKSTNYRGNDVYTGVIRRTDRSQNEGVTTVIEMTSSQTSAKNVFDAAVTKAQGEGYTYRADWVTQMNNEEGKQKATETWIGSMSYGNKQVTTYYLYDPYVGSGSWYAVTQTA